MLKSGDVLPFPFIIEKGDEKLFSAEIQSKSSIVVKIRLKEFVSKIKTKNSNYNFFFKKEQLNWNLIESEKRESEQEMIENGLNSKFDKFQTRILNKNSKKKKKREKLLLVKRITKL